MNVLCLLQNAWDFNSRDNMLIFEPNPHNRSARYLQRIVGNENFIYFCNTTNEITEKSDDVAKPNDEHFKRLLKLIKNTNAFDFMIVCGRQAEMMVNKYKDKITLPYVCIPHPNKHGMTREEANANIEIVRELMNNIKSHHLKTQNNAK